MRLQLVHGRGDVRGVELLRNVLGAVGVPGLDGEYDRLFRPRRIVRRHQLRDRLGVFDHPGAAPDFDPPAMGVIHQEQVGAVVLGQVPGGDVSGCLKSRRTPASPRRSRGGALRAAAVLDVGLAALAGGREIGAIALREKGREVRRILVRHPPRSSTRR